MTKVKLTKKQISEIRGLTLASVSYVKIHGNSKRIGSLPVELFKEIRFKKYNRSLGNIIIDKDTVINEYTLRVRKSDVTRTIEQLRYNLTNIGTNYLKMLIEGNTGIYLAHPYHKHSDYNKCRMFDKNEKTLHLMNIYNTVIYRHLKTKN